MSAVMAPVPLPFRPPVMPGGVDETAGRRQLVVNQDILIGRGTHCHLRLPSLSVSRRHCLLRVCPSAAWITDLHSGNGTFINGRALVPGCETPVMDGAKISVGPYEFTLRVQTPPGVSRCEDLQRQRDEQTEVPQSDERPFQALAAGCAHNAGIRLSQTPKSSGRGGVRTAEKAHGSRKTRSSGRAPIDIRRSDEIDLKWLAPETFHSGADGRSTLITLPEPVADSQITIVSPVLPAGTIPPEVVTACRRVPAGISGHALRSPGLRMVCLAAAAAAVLGISVWMILVH